METRASDGRPKITREPIVIPDSLLHRLLAGPRELTCVPLRTPSRLRKDAVVRVETESNRWVVRGGSRFQIWALVKHWERGPGRARKITLGGAILVPARRAGPEKVSA